MPWREYLKRWSDVDRAIVQAVLLEEAALCGRCGTAEWQWAEQTFAATIEICKGCMALDITEADLRKPGAPLAPGRRVRLIPERLAVMMAERGKGRGKRPKSPREIARERRAKA